MHRLMVLVETMKYAASVAVSTLRLRSRMNCSSFSLTVISSITLLLIVSVSVGESPLFRPSLMALFAD